MRYEELTIEGRNAVMEAFRSGKTIDKLFVLDGCQDGPIMTIKREAKKHDTLIKFVNKERLDQMSETGKHQGVIAVAAAYKYAEIEDMFALAEKKRCFSFLFCQCKHVLYFCIFLGSSNGNYTLMLSGFG